MPPVKIFDKIGGIDDTSDFQWKLEEYRLNHPSSVSMKVWHTDISREYTLYGISKSIEVVSTGDEYILYSMSLQIGQYAQPER